MKHRLFALMLTLTTAWVHAQTVLEPSNIADQDNLQISNIVFSNDGSRAFASNENYVFIWDTSNGLLLKTIAIPAFESKLRGVLNHVQSLSISPGGTKLCTTHYSLRSLILDAETGAISTTIDDGTSPSSHFYSHSQFLRDEITIFLSSEYRTLRSFNICTGELLRRP